MKSLWLILYITKTHLLSRLKQSIVAALGVTFGIGTFIILVSFMTGLNGLLDGLVLNRTPHIQIFNEVKPSNIQPINLSNEFKNGFHIIHSIKPKEIQPGVHNALPLIKLFRVNKKIKGVTPQVAAKVFYDSGPSRLNGLINGIDAREEARLFHFADYIVEGKASDLLKRSNGILLGAGAAKKMSLSLGDKIQVTSESGITTTLKIMGIYQTGLSEVDNIQSFVNIKTAQQLLGKGSNYISRIHIKLWDINLAPTLSREISKNHNLTALDIETANAEFETGTSIRNLITYAVSITLLIVAGFGIYNILNMFIYEKMDDIAILKATGFTGADVKKIFLCQALFIGLAGGVFGQLLGYGVSVLIDHTPFNTEALPTISTYPVNFDPSYYIIGMSFALLSTLLAGYFPARKAERIDPVDIIRGK